MTISCEKANALAEKKRHVPLTLTESLQFFTHMRLCRMCLKHESQNTILEILLKNDPPPDMLPHLTLPEETKARIVASIKKIEEP